MISNSRRKKGRLKYYNDDKILSFRFSFHCSISLSSYIFIFYYFLLFCPAFIEAEPTLSANELHSWMTFYNSSTGSSWEKCSDSRDFPCSSSCSFPEGSIENPRIVCHVSPVNPNELIIKEISLPNNNLFGIFEDFSISKLEYLSLLDVSNNNMLEMSRGSNCIMLSRCFSNDLNQPLSCNFAGTPLETYQPCATISPTSVALNEDDLIGFRYIYDYLDGINWKNCKFSRDDPCGLCPPQPNDETTYVRCEVIEGSLRIVEIRLTNNLLLGYIPVSYLSPKLRKLNILDLSNQKPDEWDSNIILNKKCISLPRCFSLLECDFRNTGATLCNPTAFPTTSPDSSFTKTPTIPTMPVPTFAPTMPIPSFTPTKQPMVKTNSPSLTPTIFKSSSPTKSPYQIFQNDIAAWQKIFDDLGGNNGNWVDCGTPEARENPCASCNPEQAQIQGNGVICQFISPTTNSLINLRGRDLQESSSLRIQKIILRQNGLNGALPLSSFEGLSALDQLDLSNISPTMEFPNVLQSPNPNDPCVELSLCSSEPQKCNMADSGVTLCTISPTKNPTSKSPSFSPSKSPSISPTTKYPTKNPTRNPTRSPTKAPSTRKPTKNLTKNPTNPTKSPSFSPTESTFRPTHAPTLNSGITNGEAFAISIGVLLLILMIFICCYCFLYPVEARRKRNKIRETIGLAPVLPKEEPKVRIVPPVNIISSAPLTKGRPLLLSVDVPESSLRRLKKK